MNVKRLSMVLALFSFSLLIHLTLPSVYTVIHLVVLTTAVVLMSVLRSVWNFLLLLTISLTYGFGLTIFALQMAYFDSQQYLLIQAHLALTASLLLLWVLMHEVKKGAEAYSALQLRVKELEKFDVDTRALSMTEFLERGEAVEAGMKRRGEMSRLVRLTLSDHIPPTTQREVLQKIVQEALLSVRDSYDLVTRPSENSVLLCLQNTNEEGERIVLKRLEKRLHRQLNFVRMPVEVHSEAVVDFAAQVDALLAGQEVS
ncbi:hypothetical protein [Alkalicoccus urumqiensis]|uniref:GGDEF domain-containing protein n=1 Tax=Alkalicoccus urumqiensis TaxID=1548213 RepID=A0A2P6MIJ4_ALKUR|nr:hypothetical protein [Alkalicoccus urumqiensis]PRO66087.1 hypothetical protein C6I21_07255 [Alkalicoccus urumqiensis]